MVTGIFFLTLKLICTIFGCLLLLRAYLKYLHAPANDPAFSFAYSLTQWAVGPASRFVPRSPRWDWPSLFVCYLTALIYHFFHWLTTFHGGLLGFIVGPVIMVIYWAVQLAMWCVILFAIYSFAKPTSPAFRSLSFLCYPFLAPLKKYLPVWKNIDLSAVVFFILCNVVLTFLTPFR